ncbi:MAG: NAD(P)H-hydrate dehydratase [Sedimentisphaeraceae bacterium JB056]
MGQIDDLTFLKPRETESYKNNFGRVLIIAGSIGMSGAAALTAKAALRSGAGLVELLCPDSVWPIIASAEPCLMCNPVADDHNGKISEDAIDFILERVQEADVVAIGPGLGKSEQLKELICRLITCESLPLIIDADGLNNLSQIPDWHNMLSADLIVTPHPGEMRRLCNSISDFDAATEREELAIDFSNTTGVLTVLKGSGTVVACGDDYYINDTGNPGMATAGSGDVLTGILAAIFAQVILADSQISHQQSAFKAATMAVYIHGLAGDIACDKIGEISLTATDIIDNLPDAFKSCSMTN